jgi:hypothetical protein
MSPVGKSHKPLSSLEEKIHGIRKKNTWQSGKDNVSQNMLVDERENYAYVPRFHGCTLGCLLVDDL